MLLQKAEFHSFLWLSNIYILEGGVCMCVCMYDIFLIHSSVDVHLDCFHTLTIINKVILNIGEHLSLGFLDTYLGVELLGHMIILFLVF